MTINSERLLERFLRYVRIATTVDPSSSEYPSSPGQRELGKLLSDELRAMGVADVELSPEGLVWATVPASIAADVPTILLNAHLDTSSDAPGENVQPQIVEYYGGGDIPLANGGKVIRVADCPDLASLQGHLLVTTDGTTLLGGDDKAGVAAIMELANFLIEHPHVPHGPLRILFTCDEEIGCGAQYFDSKKANATAGYTLDGSGHGEVEAENFSADQLIVRAFGVNIHPSIAKGRMVNAIRGLAMLLAELPSDGLTPETTDGRDGFLHPYRFEGNVDQANVKLLLRDFDTSKLELYANLVKQTAERIEIRVPGLKFELERSIQYRNMADALRNFPLVVDLASQAFERLGRTPKLGSIRGGTDGAMFSHLGLPTPNLSVGQHNIHSELEFVSLNEMVWAVEHAVKLLELWQQHARS